MAKKRISKSKQEYHKPHIGEILKAMCQEFNVDETKALEFVRKKFPEVLDGKRCANCGASMAIYEHEIDPTDALLLLGMGKIIGKRAKTMAFTEANRVHLQRELGGYYSVSARSSWCSKLGLITKVLRKDGTHDAKAGWLITKRGFEFLAGKPVPKKVRVFRNKITERFDETTTIAEVIKKKTDKVYSAELATHAKYPFDKLEAWAVTGFAQGVLLR